MSDFQKQQLMPKSDVHYRIVCNKKNRKTIVRITSDFYITKTLEMLHSKSSRDAEIRHLPHISITITKNIILSIGNVGFPIIIKIQRNPMCPIG